LQNNNWSTDRFQKREHSQKLLDQNTIGHVTNISGRKVASNYFFNPKEVDDTVEKEQSQQKQLIN
jgi:hypothetical protein